MSADTSEKEKIVGGILTLEQALWLAAGFIIFASIFLFFSKFLPIIIATIIALIPGLSFSLPFAFYRKGGLSLSNYLILKKKFSKKEKFLINNLLYKK